MSEELSELDELIESDVLEALGEKVTENSSVEIDGITIEDVEDTQEIKSEEPQIQEPLEESVDTDNEVTLNDEVIMEEPEQDSESQANEIDTSEQTVKTIPSTDLASLLSELLNNKTIEITIKIKD